MTYDLPAVITDTAGQPATIRIGTCIGVAPVQIDLGGTILDLAALGVIGPGAGVSVGNTVILLGQSVAGADSSGSSWALLGVIAGGAAAAAVSKRAANVTNFNTTSVPYVSTNVCGTNFVAPASGRVKISWHGEMNHPSGTAVRISPQVAAGSIAGTVFTGWAASDDRCIRSNAVATEGFGSDDLCEGLTPGVVYNVTLYHRIETGTGTISRRRVTVSPAV